MIAAGSVGAAVHGLSNVPHLDEKLLQKLQEITGIEVVSFSLDLFFLTWLVFFKININIPHIILSVEKQNPSCIYHLPTLIAFALD